MKLSAYRLVVFAQLAFLVVDLFVNAFAGYFYDQPLVALALFILQGAAVVINIIILCLVFVNTYVFKAGLVSLLFKKYRTTLVTCTLYLLLSIALHVFTMTKIWSHKGTDVWSKGFWALYVIQKMVCAPYYYLYKRTALKMGDPRLYRDSEWLQQFSKHLNS
eukprot:Opistho-2@46511